VCLLIGKIRLLLADILTLKKRRECVVAFLLVREIGVCQKAMNGTMDGRLWFCSVEDNMAACHLSDGRSRPYESGIYHSYSPEAL
jgi:hypothetical protein